MTRNSNRNSWEERHRETKEQRQVERVSHDTSLLTSTVFVVSSLFAKPPTQYNDLQRVFLCCIAKVIYLYVILLYFCVCCFAFYYYYYFVTYIAFVPVFCSQFVVERSIILSLRGWSLNGKFKTQFDKPNFKFEQKRFF